MMSVAPGEIVLRGESANRYIGMDNNGNLIAYVSIKPPGTSCKSTG